MVEDYNISGREFKAIDNKYIYKQKEKKILNDKYIIYVSNKETKKTKTNPNKIIEFFEKTFDGGIGTFFKKINYISVYLKRDGKESPHTYDIYPRQQDVVNMQTHYPYNYMDLRKGDYLDLVTIHDVSRTFLNPNLLNINDVDFLDNTSTLELYNGDVSSYEVEYEFYIEERKGKVYLSDKFSYHRRGKEIDLDLHNNDIFKQVWYEGYKRYIRFIKVTYEDIVGFYNFIRDTKNYNN